MNRYGLELSCGARLVIRIHPQSSWAIKGRMQSSEDLDAEAEAALEAARLMPPGPEKADALKKAGLLRKAADVTGIVFAPRGRRPK